MPVPADSVQLDVRDGLGVEISSPEPRFAATGLDEALPVTIEMRLSPFAGDVAPGMCPARYSSEGRTSSTVTSPRRISPVDDELAPRHELRLVGRQVYDPVRNVVRLTDVSDRM